MLRRLVATLMVPVVPLVAACTAIAPIQSPADFVATRQPARLWVTRADDSVQLIESPKLVGDTLAGFVSGQYVEVPLTTVKQVRAKHSAPARTMVLIGAAAVTTLAMSLMLTGSGGGPATCTNKAGEVVPC